jgi:Mn2+/Fe2+ NRAMP family transporter
VSALVDLLLGVVTSIGGFVEVGSISTAAQAGAEFGAALLWAVATAGVMVAMLIEMSGRLAIVSGRTVAGAVRERFGIHALMLPLCAELLLDGLLLTAELGGVAAGLQMVSGMSAVVWVLPAAFTVGAIFWLCGFAVIEDGLGILGLVTLLFVVAAWRLEPSAASLANGLIPSWPSHDPARYGLLAVSILGATVSPYLLNFYASGAIEEEMTEPELWVNRVTAFVGMGFGSVVSMGVLVTAALTLGGVRIESFSQAAEMFRPVFGSWAVPLFALALGVGCLGAATEITLNGGSLLAQVFGWQWGANRKRREAARFSITATLLLAAASLLALTGVDPLRLTMIAMALTVLVMPLLVLPFLVLMNDPRYVKSHVSGAAGNVFLAALTLLASLLALVVIPLQLFGG